MLSNTYIRICLTIPTTPCSPTCDLFTTGGSSEASQILDHLNYWRQQVASRQVTVTLGKYLPPATNMNKLLWDNSLAYLASQYTNTCPDSVSNFQTNIPNLSTNLTILINNNLTKFKYNTTQINIQATSISLKSNKILINITEIISDMYRVWWNIKQNYQFGILSAFDCPGSSLNEPNNNDCFEFKTLISANIRYVGCGYSHCNDDTSVVSCVFYPQANSQGIAEITPYEEGVESCTQCDVDRTCVQDLCGGGVCITYGDNICSTTNDCTDGLNRSLIGCPTISPTKMPSIPPTYHPSLNPSIIPTNQPTIDPTTEPTLNPTNIPSIIPTQIPTNNPTLFDTSKTDKLSRTATIFITISATLLILIIIILFCWFITHKNKNNNDDKSEDEPLSNIELGDTKPDIINTQNGEGIYIEGSGGGQQSNIINVELGPGSMNNIEIDNTGDDSEEIYDVGDSNDIVTPQNTVGGDGFTNGNNNHVITKGLSQVIDNSSESGNIEMHKQPTHDDDHDV